MLKAYEYDNDFNDESFIVFAESANKAKQIVCNSDYTDDKYIDVRVKRVKWADKYKETEKIPAEEYLKHGWQLDCAGCLERVGEDECVIINGAPYCKECASDIKNGKW